MAKLFVIPARDEPTAVILRRGPSNWYHVIQWDTQRDYFVHGAWIKGRIYEEQCDISPDGRLLLCFILQGRRIRTESTDIWTAVSRAPWLKALVLWPQGSTFYGGGGRFIENDTVALRSIVTPPLDSLSSHAIRTVEEADIPAHTSSKDVPDSDWCGRDHEGRIIFSRAGELFRRTMGKETLIADFSNLKPNPQSAPDWAAEPL